MIRTKSISSQKKKIGGGYYPREMLKGNRDTSSIVNGGKAEYGHSQKTDSGFGDGMMVSSV